MVKKFPLYITEQDIVVKTDILVNPEHVSSVEQINDTACLISLSNGKEYNVSYTIENLYNILNISR